MEEVNPEGTSQPFVARAPSALPESHVDPAPPVPSSSHENCQGDNESEQRIDQDEQSSSYKEASEIAGRFVEVIDPKSHVDTAGPIASVEGAVSKFGGILDWSNRRVQLQDELAKVQQEVSKYQKRSQEAEEAMKELESTASVAGELRLSLEKAHAEEAQARQETELAELRLGAVRRGASESAAALADLQLARAELASLEKERAAAAADADAVMARAREAAAASQEAGKAVEDLAAELVALKGELESAHAAHGEAEEKRRLLAAAFEQDKSQWQSELEEAEQEAKKLRDELMAACDLELKAEAASEELTSLKAEETPPGEEEKPSSKAMLEEAKQELEDVKESIDKAKDEAKCLRFAADSMRDHLEREKAELAALQRKEGLSAASIASLEEELNLELAATEARAKKEVHDESKMADEQIEEARREAEQAKGKARSAREEATKAREEATVAKAAVAAVEARLEAVMQEILAANTSEEMATASANALLQETKPSSFEGGGVTLTMEEYGELSRRAREMEEAAGKRVIEAVKLIKEAKDAEVRSLDKLTQAAKRTVQRMQALQAATEEAEEAEFAKLSAERELRQWRTEHERQPRTGLAEISVLDDPSGDGRGNPNILSPRGAYMPRTDVTAAAGAAAEAEAEVKQRKTFFPRMVMFLARKRAQSWK